MKRLFRKRNLTTAERNVLFFAAEGACFAVVTALGNNTNNLFLTRLGASDFQLSLFTMIAQIVSMVCLVPLAIFTDRMKDKRKMVFLLLCFIGGCYLFAAAVPFLGSAALYPMIAFIGLAVGGVELCTSTWQAFFADATEPDERNRVFATRNQTMFFFNICIPLLAGFLLTVQDNVGAQIITHQIYYVVIACSAALNIVMLSRIKGGAAVPTGKSFKEFGSAIAGLVKNKNFLFFAAVAFFFYFTWRLDGTLFFVGQTQYVGLSDFWYIFSNVTCSIVQILTIRFWARMNERFGVRFTLIFGGIGLIISPFCIIVPLAFEGPLRFVLHILLRMTADFSFATVTLNVLQNLLQVVGEKNRALSIAAYTTLIALTSAFGPMIGVAIYTAFGADQNGIICAFLVICGLRILSGSGLAFRWWKLRKRGNILYESESAVTE